jgi:hypothetical protein
MCPVHASRATTADQILDDKSVFRKVWINRDEVKQIQKSVILIFNQLISNPLFCLVI